MTLSGTIPVEQTVADGITATFNYGFEITAASDLLVMQNAVIASPGSYTVAGVGNETGGTFTFTAAPPVGTIISRFRVVDYGQTTSYNPLDAFLSQNHEQSVDDLAMQTTQLVEQFQRIPVFPREVNGTLRGMALPYPEALKLLQWNADANGLTNAESAIQTVVPLPGGGARVFAQATVAVTAVSGELSLTTGTIVPAGARLLEGMAYNGIAFGTSLGLSSYSLGTLSAPERYGRGISINLGAVTNAGMARNWTEEPAPSGLALTLTADDGKFDADGQAIVTAAYVIVVPPQSVP